MQTQISRCEVWTNPDAQLQQLHNAPQILPQTVQQLRQPMQSLCIPRHVASATQSRDFTEP